MSKEIWNEGRVVGYSAYEIYLKQFLENNPDPDLPPATEKEWLASSIGSGASMILQVPGSNSSITEDDHYYVDIPLPAESKLCAANTIVASFFDGSAYFEDDVWANFVTSYGDLIVNSRNLSSSVISPEDDTTTQNICNNPSSVPVGDLNPPKGQNDPPNRDISADKLIRIKNYMKIKDGVVIQPGHWDELNDPPYDYNRSLPTFNILDKDESQDISLTSLPVVRLHIHGIIGLYARPLVLLTGFTDKSVVAGVVDNEGSVPRAWDELDYNGKDIGPANFPWANRIIFTVPPDYVDYYRVDINHEIVPGQRTTTPQDKQINSAVIVTADNTFRCLEIAPPDSSSYEDVYNIKGNDGIFTPGLINIRSSGGVITPYRGSIHWDDLMYALSMGYSIDVIGDGITAGSYMTIERDSSGRLKITNDAPATKQKIYDNLNLILQAGPGIALEADGNKIKIINTKPYTPGGVSYKFLYKSSNLYTVSLQNNWHMCTTRNVVLKHGSVWDLASNSSVSKWLDNTEATRNIMFGYNGDTLVKNKTTGLYSGTLFVRFKFGPTYDMVTADYNKPYITNKTVMENNYNHIYLGNGNIVSYNSSGTYSYNFKFKHSSNDAEQTSKSLMCGFKFKGVLAPLNTASWNSDCEDGVWNIYELYKHKTATSTKKANDWDVKDGGASWIGHIGITGSTSNMYKKLPAATRNAVSVVMYGINYADGYNNQLNRWITMKDTSKYYVNSTKIGASSINFTAKATVYVSNFDYDGLEAIRTNRSKNYYQTALKAKNFSDTW